LLDKAKAREDWICQLKFKHSKEPELTEEDWEVTHYFKKPGTYEFHFTIIHSRCTDVKQSANPPPSHSFRSTGMGRMRILRKATGP
jgi:hypothetical protein